MIRSLFGCFAPPVDAQPCASAVKTQPSLRDRLNTIEARNNTKIEEQTELILDNIAERMSESRNLRTLEYRHELPINMKSFEDRIIDIVRDSCLKDGSCKRFSWITESNDVIVAIMFTIEW